MTAHTPQTDLYRQLFTAALQGLCANSSGPIQANPLSGWGYVNCNAHGIAEMAADIATSALTAIAKAEGR